MSRLTAALVMVLLAGCGGHDLRLNAGVPKPRVTVPYGMIAVELETGRTRNAKLRVKRLSFFTREVAIQHRKVVWFKLPSGDWRIDVMGDIVKPRVVSMSGYEDGVRSDGKAASWPEKPLVVTVKNNKLTNLGRICAHEGCKAHWQPSELPGLDPWKRMDRLITYKPPPKKTEKAAKKSAEDKGEPAPKSDEPKVDEKQGKGE